MSRVLRVAHREAGPGGSRTSFYSKPSTWAPYRKGPSPQRACLLGSLHSLWGSVPAPCLTGTQADASVGAKPSPLVVRHPCPISVASAHALRP